MTTNDDGRWIERRTLICESTDPEGKVYRQEEEVAGELQYILTVQHAAADVDAATSRWDAMLAWLQERLPHDEFLHVETRADDLLIATRAEAAARMIQGALALERERRPMLLAAPAPDAEAVMPGPAPDPIPCPPRREVRRMIASVAAAFVAGLGIGAAMRGSWRH